MPKTPKCKKYHNLAILSAKSKSPLYEKELREVNKIAVLSTTETEQSKIAKVVSNEIIKGIELLSNVRLDLISCMELAENISTKIRFKRSVNEKYWKSLVNGERHTLKEIGGKAISGVFFNKLSKRCPFVDEEEVTCNAVHRVAWGVAQIFSYFRDLPEPTETY